ncbi:MAG: glycoside hydrolase family 127 protein [Planctomycetes bacterium]|nr:glycoside hydrolase family 127 protein [Planctomycetota bacterium]
MIRPHRLLLPLGCALAAAVPAQAPQRDYPFRPVPFTAVHLSDPLWAPRIETNRAVTIRYAFEQCEETGRIENFRVAGGLSDGRWTGGYGFNDSDLSKIVEGASYALVTADDPELRDYVAGIARLYATAQEPDGFLYTLWTARKTVADYARVGCRPELSDRWSNIASAHQLYNVGHMYEAGVAHWLATGDRTLLDVCIRNADLVCATFGPDGRRDPPGHQEIEIGLAKLYRATGDRKYLDQARWFLEARGRHEGGSTYNQDHQPAREQSEAVGHAVRACYMYAGMADVAALTGDEDYLRAVDRLWDDVVRTKLYVTGGVGASGAGEAFGGAYDLPNRTAYCETCAAIANAYWNHRMFLLHGDARYVDVMERALYNNVLSGVALDGRHFFYPNPLASNGEHERSPWFGCACCPSNVTRFLASLGGYVYATRGDSIFVNLYAQCDATVPIDAGDVRLQQRTRMPWDGAVALTVTPDAPRRFALRLRVPGWATGQPVPSGLYRVTGGSQPAFRLRVRVGDGGAFAPPVESGYAVVDREWQPGDTVSLELPLDVLRLDADPQVEADLGRVALQRGPAVFCVEHPDVEGGQVHALMLPDDATLTPTWRPELLGGVVTLDTGTAYLTRFVDGTEGREIAADKTSIRAIPYAVWAHRGRGEMAVWLPRDREQVTPLPLPTIASRARASASDPRGSLAAVQDQREPKSSGDHTWPFLHWWPHKGTEEWLQYDLAEPTSVSQVAVYWFDDTGRGECRLPASWQLLHRDGTQWREVRAADSYGCTLDRYNVVRFAPVTTDALRIVVRLQPGWSAGVHEWRVE